MSDPYAPRRLCVTIKVPESKRYAADNPWLVFEGDVEGIREMMADTFGLDVEGKSLFQVTLEAQQQATSMGSVSQVLGGKVLNDGKGGEPSQSDSPAPAAGGSVFDQARESGPPWPVQEEKAPVDPILAAIESCKAVGELQQVWAENQAAFNANGAYMDAYKAKGKSLSTGN